MKELAKKTLEREKSNPLEKRLAKAVLDLNADVGRLSQENMEMKQILANIHQFAHNFYAKVRPVYKRYQIVKEEEEK